MSDETPVNDASAGGKARGESESEIPDKVFTAIPEVFYDLISRIVPGAFAIQLFTGFDFMEKQDGKLLVIGLPIFSWGIGLALETSTNAGVFVFRRYICAYWGADPSAHSEDKSLLFPLNERRRVIKFLAESSFCRIMCFVFAVAVFLPRTAIHSHLFDNRMVRFVGASVFLFCWVFKNFEYRMYRWKVEKLLPQGGPSSRNVGLSD